MQIEKNAVVAIDYTLRDTEGEVLDASPEGQPLQYLHGAGNIIPGLETALEGKAAGDDVEVTVPPEEGYGERDDRLQQDVPKSMFEGVDTVEAGMRFQAQTQSGTQVVTVAAVSGDSVTVDANHPLAGQTLNFKVKVSEVREASDEELEHGHVHDGEQTE
ncbi:FKBP-type peptidyl-prolyl cis-trans isomerase [Spiribacter vilamensis]|uniref:Peptidyl-prolyl cis-trans isomerase n=1 Tax=Spiribacter vilamensis TaxID=531306 RepID=A0A4Q8D1B3_9GAMM|nr:peptidylprolyl isomerase [Spiribacter vilamensis]RZU99037.1 FKBP-type peptidyl prolyl cis-trans isomerase /apo-metallochaperone SlyD [Spiribacter vilamensis]TVO61961.1 peptidylprolyl isomerase [Spiribacter vilamensis]